MHIIDFLDQMKIGLFKIMSFYVRPYYIRSFKIRAFGRTSFISDLFPKEFLGLEIYILFRILCSKIKIFLNFSYPELYFFYIILIIIISFFGLF